jgi:hypothetical protein
MHPFCRFPQRLNADEPVHQVSFGALDEWLREKDAHREGVSAHRACHLRRSCLRDYGLFTMPQLGGGNAGS